VNKSGNIEFRYVLPFDRKVDSKTLARWIDSMTSRTDAIMRVHGRQLGKYIGEEREQAAEPEKPKSGA
jgi:hypothetical protein